MTNFFLSTHARNMLVERQIEEEWLWRTLSSPDDFYSGTDENRHFLKAIAERQGRILHVVVNDYVQPNRIVTLFFDRRVRKKE